MSYILIVGCVPRGGAPDVVVGHVGVGDNINTRKVLITKYSRGHINSDFLVHSHFNYSSLEYHHRIHAKVSCYDKIPRICRVNINQQVETELLKILILR